MSKDNRNGKGRKEFRIPDEVLDFAKMNFKKFKKRNAYAFESCDSKKEKREVLKGLRKDYFEELIELLPKTIAFTVYYSHRREVKDYIDKIYSNLFDPEFVKYLKKLIVKKKEDIPGMELWPVMMYYFVSKMKDVENAENIDLTDLYDLSKTILSKKMKKFAKKGIPEAQSFDYLSIMPDAKILAKGNVFYCSRLMKCMYEHALTEEVKFGEIMKLLFKSDDEELDKSMLLVFILLEKKEKISNFNDTQKQLFNDITSWTMNELESLSKSRIEKIIRLYIERRRNDEKNGEDGNRRIYFKNVSADDYPKVKSVTKELSETDELNKYL